MLFAQFSDTMIQKYIFLFKGLCMYSEYIGRNFGKWKVLNLFKKNNKHHFVVECECGKQFTATSYHVVNGFTKSCKHCAPKKHGYYNTPTNRSWSGARNRCNNPNNKDYAHYGARGIKMCERWNSFDNFLSDMGEKPKGLSLDRINNEGNYEPGNCRWATYSQQNSNQRKRLTSNK